VDCRYLDALIQTIKLAPVGVQVFPVFIPGDALVQRARNSLCKMAIDAFEGEGVDDLVFIDADISWNSADFYKLLSHDVDIVGGIYRQKRDPEVLVLRPAKKPIFSKDGLIEVESTGCGFLRISGVALRKLWGSSQKYFDGDVELRSIFEVVVKGGEMISEDIAMCHKWAKLRGSIFCDTSILCDHSGSKVWSVTRRAQSNDDLTQ
jgi:hypothetical protein